ncbi:ATP-dependent zinc protease family protein [Cerasicoccus fimbriatus]|uniref:ATP-dependent zinc protease family protein n=1 Tax=Cerasicoccus fimbriatus TaxID=3014554 RepID=UPI0022B3B17D|nr:RimK/LysX family protein [Cerasicoccus sp. TK19100]
MATTHKKSPRPPVPIGWKETIDLPDWGAANLVAKADTGAKSSALDVRNIQLLPNGRVRFTLAADRKDASLTQEIEADIVKEQKVRSSNGQLQRRVKVETTLKIGRRRKKVTFSLVNRHHMICRVLLGREALAGDFVVDSSQKYLHGKRKKPQIH